MSRLDIRYIAPAARAPGIPPYEGDSYDDLVPDTPDLPERIELGVNGLTGPTDPEADHELYFWADFFCNPPMLYHTFDDWCQPKFMEALPLLRTASGSTAASEVDESWMRALVSSLGPDGLSYTPLQGRPWSRLDYSLHESTMTVYRRDGSTTTLADRSVTQVTSITVAARLLGALTIYHLRDPGGPWRRMAETMVERLAALAIDRGDHCFFPVGVFEPGAVFGKRTLDAARPEESICDFGGGRLPESLARLHRVTGFAPALDLARRLASAVVDHSRFFDAEGRFLSRREYTAEGQAAVGRAAEAVVGGHFHSHTIVLLSLLEYAIEAGDADLLSFVKASYAWARTQGSTLTGCFPTVIHPERDSGATGTASPWYDEFETCELADMTAIALKLGALGEASCYADAERWTRNFLLEAQLTRSDWVYRKPRVSDRRAIPPNATADRAAERCVGAFGGWMSGSDWATRMGCMHCCTGNAARTLYYLWEHAVRRDGGLLSVNLLLNHASPWADVHSHDPYAGRLDVRLKEGFSELAIRLPETAASAAARDAAAAGLRLEVNGSPRGFALRGGYVVAGPVRRGETVALCYPIREYAIRELLCDSIYALVVRGTTVVDVEPRGHNCPIFLRDHYRNPATRWRSIRRYVPKERIAW